MSADAATLSLLRSLESRLEESLADVRKALGTPLPPPPAPPTAPSLLRAPAHALIVVDPGHGGSDPGAHVPSPEEEEGGGAGEVREKDLVVPYAMGLRELLIGAGYDVLLTRNDDTFVGLSQRANIANDAGALCFISIHANAASNKVRNGAWVLYDDATTEEKGHALAECIFTEMAAVPGLTDDSPQHEVFPDGSPWVAGRQLTVLSKTQMPAVIVELSFMTNADDLNQLLDPGQRKLVTEAITRGIITWHAERLPV